MNFNKLQVGLRLVLLAVFLQCSVSLGEERGAKPAEATQAVYQKTLKASAWVVPAQLGCSGRQGTGFLIDRSHHWLTTNAHVVGEATTVRVFFPMKDRHGVVTDRKAYLRTGGSIRGRVVATDPRRDLAVVELQVVPGDVEALSLAAAPPSRYERVFQVGNPGAGQLWEPNTGRVAAFTSQTPRNMDQKQYPTLGYWVREDHPARPGCSGGPVVNANGRVIGVITRSNAPMQEFCQVLPQLSGLTASIPAGPMHFLLCNQVKSKPPTWLAWCVDFREVEDVLALVRQDEVRARRILQPRSAEDFIDSGLHYLERERPDFAFEDFNAAVERDPTKARAYSYRGAARRNLGQLFRALGDFDEAIRRDPNDAHPYRERALVFLRQKDSTRAIADASESIQRDGNDMLARLYRAGAYTSMGDYAKAADDLAEAVRLAPDDPKALNALAWHLATCPDKNRRDGQKALTYARRACELSQWKNAMMLDTLAAAHAECGQFSEAVQSQKKALELADKQHQVRFRARLKLYKENQPYRGL